MDDVAMKAVELLLYRLIMMRKLEASQITK